MYLLQQRLGGKPPGRAANELSNAWEGLPKDAYFNSVERSWMGQSTFRPTRRAENGEDWDEWEEAGFMEDESWQ